MGTWKCQINTKCWEKAISTVQSPARKISSFYGMSRTTFSSSSCSLLDEWKTAIKEYKLTWKTILIQNYLKKAFAVSVIALHCHLHLNTKSYRAKKIKSPSFASFQCQLLKDNPKNPQRHDELPFWTLKGQVNKWWTRPLSSLTW